jgi:enoyl-CoA hydratase/carnithine racemase
MNNTPELVTREDRDGLAILTLNRPDKLNALTLAMFEELSVHCTDIANATDRIGLVVVRGAGRCFSAGHDLGDIGQGEGMATLVKQGQAVEQLANLPQPVITAVHGHCYTGALELALAGDMVVAAESAKFADTHAKWALTPVWGLSQRLPRRVGPSKAREMMMTCATYSGREAQAIGLADKCWPDAEFDAELDKLARAILVNSWFSLRANKALLIETDGLPLAAGLAHECYRTRGHGPDMAERIAEFSKRKG